MVKKSWLAVAVVAFNLVGVAAHADGESWSPSQRPGYAKPTGSTNTGHTNTGHTNTGYSNTGNTNNGYNPGYGNTGSTGHTNAGYNGHNPGTGNTGNTGHTGHTGHTNPGHAHDVQAHRRWIRDMRDLIDTLRDDDLRMARRDLKTLIRDVRQDGSPSAFNRQIEQRLRYIALDLNDPRPRVREIIRDLQGVLTTLQNGR